MNKKGQTDVAGLYNFILLLVLIGLVVGVGLVVLGNFSSSTAIDINNNATNGGIENLTASAAETALNNTVSAIGAIPNTWLSLIVTVAVLAIILTLVIKSFGGMNRR